MDPPTTKTQNLDAEVISNVLTATQCLMETIILPVCRVHGTAVDLPVEVSDQHISILWFHLLSAHNVFDNTSSC